MAIRGPAPAWRSGARLRQGEPEPGVGVASRGKGGYIQPGTTMTSHATNGAIATTEKPKISSSR